jgi:serine/threonine protein kinase
MNLKHANIVKVRDFFEDIQSEKSYLVMEQAGTMSLQDLVQIKPLSEREAKSLIRQLLEAIRFLHS